MTPGIEDTYIVVRSKLGPAWLPGPHAGKDSYWRHVIQVSRAGPRGGLDDEAIQVPGAGHARPGRGLVALPAGQIRRMVVRGQHHETHGSRFFSAMVAGNGSGWLGDDHVIVTIAVTADDPGAYFGMGDHFALWLGSDIAGGVVTRRLFL